MSFDKLWEEKRQNIDHYLVIREGKWFGHCFIILVFPDGGLRIESLWAKLDIEPLTEAAALVALEMFIKCGWKVEKVEPLDMPLRIPGLGTCVSVCKRILGINKPWIITPAQLARWIDGESLG